MDLQFEEIPVTGYEKVLKVTDSDSNLTGIIAIHNTQMGPALGGIRIQAYESFDEALDDVLRLSKGMTYKSAVAGTGLGGGKSVIIADHHTEKTPEKLAAFGEAIERLQGLYIGAEDMGCTPDDVGIIRQQTPYVVGLTHEGSSGNPAPFTSWGTFRGIQATVKHLDGTTDLSGKTFALQGLGSVGMLLAETLFWHGANLIVADVNAENTRIAEKKFGAKVVPVTEILTVECDVLVPCARGGIINSLAIPNLRCRAIAGCANNQLENDENAEELKKYGIAYAPDFVINSGGLLNVLCELAPDGYDPLIAREKTANIFQQVELIFDIARKNGISTHQAAIELAEYRIKYGIGKREEELHFCEVTA